LGDAAARLEADRDGVDKGLGSGFWRFRHSRGRPRLRPSVLLPIVGFFNLIYGIAAIANSHVFTANARYVFANLRTWGWLTLIIAMDLVALYGLCACASRENLAAA
jgi:hypothetical protein